MPRRLSNPEWLAFQNQVDLNALALPPWGGIVQWGSQFILVYICPSSGSLCQKGEAMLTDVSDRQDLIRNVPGTYDTNQEIWVYHLPQELMQRVVAVSQNTLEATGKIIQTVAETTGAAAGALTGPLLENLALPLALVAVLFLFTQGPRR